MYSSSKAPGTDRSGHQHWIMALHVIDYTKLFIFLFVVVAVGGILSVHDLRVVWKDDRVQTMSELF
jgi:hypothetical protein